ncbi:MAG: HepT-like ribonuclease domain-containing protein [Planctomycetaceae bacterium]
MRDDRRRLEDVAEAIARIERQASRGKVEFSRDELVQVWIVHHLQIIGEAVRGLSTETRDNQPQVPWSKIVGMRHILVHQYFEIDQEIVWAVVEKDLPALKSAVEGLLRTMSPEP